MPRFIYHREVVFYGRNMAALKFSTAVRNAWLDSITTLAGANATIKLYTGTQPAGGGSVTTLLATMTCAATLADSAAAGALTLNAITADSAADATGTATWFRLATSGGSFVMDGDVSTTSGAGDLQLDTTAIVLNGTVSLSGPNILFAPNAA